MSTKSSQSAAVVPAELPVEPAAPVSGSLRVPLSMSALLERRHARRGRLVPLDVGDEPHAALIGEVRVSPLQQHAQPVSKSDQVHDMDEEPEKPRQAAGEFYLAEIGYRAGASDRREIALVEVVKVLAGLVAQVAQNVPRGRGSLLIRRRTDARNHPSVLNDNSEISNGENLGMARHREIGAYVHPADTIELRVEKRAQRRCLVARRPEGGARANLLVADA